MSLLRTLCKFRISLHSFKVNLIRRSKGKYLVGTDYSNCSSGGIENEFHLLSVLDKYKDLRNAYLGPPLENSVMADTTGITKQHKLEFVIMYIYYLPPVPHILA